MELLLSGNEVKSVFALNGFDENSATKALGWTLQRCPTFCSIFVKDLVNVNLVLKDTIVNLQTHKKSLGLTDIEITCSNICQIIIEAKLNWDLPTTAQLTKYSKRFQRVAGVTDVLVTLSSASQGYASLYQPQKVGTIPLAHRSWSDVHKLILAAYSKIGSFEEKLWLRQLGSHLEEYMAMQRAKSNEVYLVSLSRKPAGNNKSHTYVDVVEKDKAYFHPVGNTWPVSPPNYIGFRYDGKVQSVHHIEKYDVVINLAAINPNWPVTTKNQFVYKLGPPMIPAREILSGPIRAMRVRCAIDTLLSGKLGTVRDARDETKKRI